MASITASLPPPLLMPGRKTLQKVAPSPIRGKQRFTALVVKASGESSESPTSLNIVKSVQNVWSDPEDRLGLIGLGFAAIAAFWASANLITAIDKIPLIPNAMEFIGILFSSWFIYRYLLFRPDREELIQIIKNSLSSVFGQ